MIHHIQLPEPLEWPEWEQINSSDMPEPKFHSARTFAYKKREIFFQRLTMNGCYRESRYWPLENLAFIWRDGKEIIFGYLEERTGTSFYKPGIENFRHSLTDLSVLILGTSFPLNLLLKQETGIQWHDQCLAPDDSRLPHILFSILSNYMKVSNSGPYWVPDPKFILDMRHNSMPRKITYHYPPPFGDAAAELTNPLLSELMALHDNWIQNPFESRYPDGRSWETTGHLGRDF